jgi:hypothetical protein
LFFEVFNPGHYINLGKGWVTIPGIKSYMIYGMYVGNGKVVIDNGI